MIAHAWWRSRDLHAFNSGAVRAASERDSRRRWWGTNATNVVRCRCACLHAEQRCGAVVPDARSITSLIASADRMMDQLHHHRSPRTFPDRSLSILDRSMTKITESITNKTQRFTHSLPASPCHDRPYWDLSATRSMDPKEVLRRICYCAIRIENHSVQGYCPGDRSRL